VGRSGASACRVDAQNLPVGAVGCDINRAVRPLANVTDALAEFGQKALFGDNLAVAEHEPGQMGLTSEPTNRLPAHSGTRLPA